MKKLDDSKKMRVALLGFSLWFFILGAGHSHTFPSADSGMAQLSFSRRVSYAASEPAGEDTSVTVADATEPNTSASRQRPELFLIMVLLFVVFLYIATKVRQRLLR